MQHCLSYYLHLLGDYFRQAAHSCDLGKWLCVYVPILTPYASVECKRDVKVAVVASIVDSNSVHQSRMV